VLIRLGISSAGEQDDRLRSEQIRMLYRGGPIGVLVAGIGAFMLGGMVLYLGAIPKGATYVWLTVVAADVASHLLVARAYYRARPAEADWLPWARAFTVFSLIEGLIWGASAFTLVAPGATEQQLLVMLVVCAVTTGAVSAFGVYPPAFFALFMPATFPFALTSAVQGGVMHLSIAGMVLVFIIGMVFIAARHNGIVLEALRLRFANLDLAEDLQLQNRAAEEATQAKSRFLAAASHDLRQPVHALGLFVGALRSQDLAPVPRQLVDRMEESLIALNGLFSGLLDISRLDAGIVAPSRSAFALQPLLDMLDRDHRGEADAKGIDLRILPSRAVIDSDPVLLGRILSNLVSNAVRYTDRGRVLVGCRRGAALRIQVLDTGPGIPEAQVERVFEEFFQLHNPQRDRSQGLGLGLAIVRRLARLLDHEIRLTSVVGRGSAFSISAPMAAAGAAAVRPAAAPEPASAEGPGSLILVIDDESPIRDGMRSLLESWGHRVICAPSGSEMVAAVAACPDRPDLIICDYRLADGETGVDAIQMLRAEYNDDIAAMLTTGDTAPDRLNEARQSGFLLLHKPVANSRLRAAVTNLLRKTDPAVLA
jgi:signal transduction histidine kinase/CheY-like chemotaxis protein